MIGTIRKHQTWLWVVIIAVTVVSFVFWGSNRGGNPFASASTGNFGVLAGNPISREQFANARNEVMLDGFFKSGQQQQWPNPESTEVLRDTYFRLLFIQKEKELGVQISTEAAAAFAHRILGGLSLDEFSDKVLKPVGLDAADFERFLRHELAMEQLVQTAGVSGKLVTPQEAETMFKLENQEIQSSVVYFSGSNFLSQVSVTPQAISQYYSNQLATYRIPEQVQVSYVKFNVTNFLAPVQAVLTNLDQIVDANMDHLGTNLFRGTKTVEESRAAIRREVLREAARKEARKAAGKFADELDHVQPRSVAGLQKLASTNGLSVFATAPFDREDGPQDILVLPNFAQKAFELTPEDPFGGPVVSEDGVYVMALKNRTSSRTPDLDEIQSRVVSDYRNATALQAAQRAALAFATSASNSIAGGKTFAAICAQAGVKYESLPPFSLNTRSLPEEIENRIEMSMLRQVAFSTPVGKSSPAAPARDGAFVLYVEKRLPIDDAKIKKELPAFIAYVRQARQNDAFNQWFNAQLRQDPEFLQAVQHVVEEAQMKTSSARPPKS